MQAQRGGRRWTPNAGAGAGAGAGAAERARCVAQGASWVSGEQWSNDGMRQERGTGYALQWDTGVQPLLKQCPFESPLLQVRRQPCLSKKDSALAQKRLASPSI